MFLSITVSLASCVSQAAQSSECTRECRRLTVTRSSGHRFRHREAIALFKEGVAIQKRVGAGVDLSSRLLTDLTGPFYTVVWEITVPNLAAFEGAAPRLMGDKEWQANYQKIGSLVESGSREMFTLVE